MNNSVYNGNTPALEVYENRAMGTLGAFLFSLSGGIIWYVLFQVGFLAAISGFVGIVAAIKGYTLFAKKSSTYGVVISIAFTVVVMVAAWYLCNATEIYNVFKPELGDELSFMDCLKAVPDYFAEPEVAKAWIYNLAMGLGFSVLGGFWAVRDALKKQKAPTGGDAAANGEKSDDIGNIDNL